MTVCIEGYLGFPFDFGSDVRLNAHAGISPIKAPTYFFLFLQWRLILICLGFSLCCAGWTVVVRRALLISGFRWTLLAHNALGLIVCLSLSFALYPVLVWKAFFTTFSQWTLVRRAGPFRLLPISHRSFFYACASPDLASVVRCGRAVHISLGLPGQLLFLRQHYLHFAIVAGVRFGIR